MISGIPHLYSMSQFCNKDIDIVPSISLLPILPEPGVKEYLEILVPWPSTFFFPLTAFSCNAWGLKHIYMYTTTHKATFIHTFPGNHSINGHPLGLGVHTQVAWSVLRRPRVKRTCWLWEKAFGGHLYKEFQDNLSVF